MIKNICIGLALICFAAAAIGVKIGNLNLVGAGGFFAVLVAFVNL